VALAVLTGNSTAQSVASRDPMIGRLVPTFAWAAMDDSAKIISPLSLKGSVVLIDMWATWCGPCRKELPFMHDAYARFHAQGFEIVSISFDEAPGKVTEFRDDFFPMPWQHVFASPDIENDVVRIFRIDGFPRAVLVDRDGRVLRVDSAVRGPALAATLDSLLAGRLSPPR
jgi:thiol-disulfide isomerase/thioredoxin